MRAVGHIKLSVGGKVWMERQAQQTAFVKVVVQWFDLAAELPDSQNSIKT